MKVEKDSFEKNGKEYFGKIIIELKVLFLEVI